MTTMSRPPRIRRNPDTLATMDQTEIKYFIEAAMLAAGRPLSVDQLQGLFDGRSAPSKPDIRAAIEALVAEYEDRGITVAEVASGFRIQVKTGMAERLQKLWEERPPRYSRALFETLALIAYRQPITRGEIEEVRGVSVSPNIVRTLLERDWVRVVGHRDVPGRPEMFGTTRTFLDHFGLKKLDDLPPLADLSDWESLRVQLNLPEVEEESGAGPEATADVPVLYPEIGEEEPDEDPRAGDDAASSEEPLPEIADVEEQLVVSEWPDPNQPVITASLDTGEDADDDKDASANG
jgi:segregation and condensation protein B